MFYCLDLLKYKIHTCKSLYNFLMEQNLNNIKENLLGKLKLLAETK